MRTPCCFGLACGVLVAALALGNPFLPRPARAAGEPAAAGASARATGAGLGGVLGQTAGAGAAAPAAAPAPAPPTALLVDWPRPVVGFDVLPPQPLVELQLGGLQFGGLPLGEMAGPALGSTQPGATSPAAEAPLAWPTVFAAPAEPPHGARDPRAPESSARSLLGR